MLDQLQCIIKSTLSHTPQGEEVFNTYGQVSNLHLMHMYGFAEKHPSNTNDVVSMNQGEMSTMPSCHGNRDINVLL